jgi:hypothetical protein
LVAYCIEVPAMGLSRGAPPITVTRACALARSSVATCGTSCCASAFIASGVPGTLARTLPQVPCGSIDANAAGSDAAGAGDHGPFTRSAVVNQRPEASSHHAPSDEVVNRSQLAFVTAYSPSATAASFAGPSMLTRQRGVVLTTMSGGSAGAAGAGAAPGSRVGAGSGVRFGSAASIAATCSGVGARPATYGPVKADACIHVPLPTRVNQVLEPLS